MTIPSRECKQGPVNSHRLSQDNGRGCEGDELPGGLARAVPQKPDAKRRGFEIGKMIRMLRFNMIMNLRFLCLRRGSFPQIEYCGAAHSVVA